MKNNDDNSMRFKSMDVNYKINTLRDVFWDEKMNNQLPQNYFPKIFKSISEQLRHKKVPEKWLPIISALKFIENNGNFGEIKISYNDNNYVGIVIDEKAGGKI